MDPQWGNLLNDTLVVHLHRYRQSRVGTRGAAGVGSAAVAICNLIQTWGIPVCAEIPNTRRGRATSRVTTREERLTSTRHSRKTELSISQGMLFLYRAMWI